MSLICPSRNGAGNNETFPLLAAGPLSVVCQVKQLTFSAMQLILQTATHSQTGKSNDPYTGDMLQPRTLVTRPSN